MLLLSATVLALGFAISVAAHVSSLLNHDWMRPPLMMTLHAGCVAAGFGIVLLARGANHPVRANSFSSLAPHAPEWMNVICGILFAYAFVNFFWCIFRLQDGTPNRQADGTFAIVNHGKFVRFISEAEYDAAEAMSTRAFSGHWMLFYWFELSMVVSIRRRKLALKRWGQALFPMPRGPR